MLRSARASLTCVESPRTMRPRTPYTKEALQYKRLHRKKPILRSSLLSHRKNIFYARRRAKPTFTSIIEYIDHFRIHYLEHQDRENDERSHFIFPNVLSNRLWLKPSNIVPSPQILSDSKKTSSPRRCWTNHIFRYFSDSILIIQLFMLLNCASASHLSNTFPPCKNFGFFTQSNETVTDRCTVWSDNIIPEICSAGTQTRVRILKHVFLFPELQPLSLFEMFSVGLKSSETWQLNTGEKGMDCISGSINRCTSCFKRISGTLRKLNEAYRSFDTTLSRFDCLPAIDTASATRPFSPNATCENCKIWYRRWLLVQSLQIWQRPACINWCYYTQLACPHLAPAKLWDYAGHPSFQCRDMDIDSWRHECDCIHPCDVKGIVTPGATMGNAPSVQHDFFAAQIHCDTRKQECHKRFKQFRKEKRSENNNNSANLPNLSLRFPPKSLLSEVSLFLLLFFQFLLL